MTSAVSPRFGRRTLKAMSVSGSRGVPFAFSFLNWDNLMWQLFCEKVSEWWVIECRYVVLPGKTASSGMSWLETWE